jgi:hypothetical protein
MADADNTVHDQEEPEPLVSMSDLKSKPLQYYSPEGKSEDHMVFDESVEGINVFDGYEGEQTQPGHAGVLNITQGFDH